MDRGFLENKTKGHENNYIFHKVIVVAIFFFGVMVIQEALKKSYLGNFCA